jgi:hypothetical protein
MNKIECDALIKNYLFNRGKCIIIKNKEEKKLCFITLNKDFKENIIKCIEMFNKNV